MKKLSFFVSLHIGRKEQISQPLKGRTKTAADDISIFYFNLLKETGLQRIHLKHQVLFSLKNNEKIFMRMSSAAVVIGWRFKGYNIL